MRLIVSPHLTFALNNTRDIVVDSVIFHSKVSKKKFNQILPSTVDTLLTTIEYIIHISLDSSNFSNLSTSFEI